MRHRAKIEIRTEEIYPREIVISAPLTYRENRILLSEMPHATFCNQIAIAETRKRRHRRQIRARRYMDGYAKTSLREIPTEEVEFPLTHSSIYRYGAHHVGVIGA